MRSLGDIEISVRSTARVAGPKLLEYEWLACGDEDFPAAHHHLTVVSPPTADPLRFLSSGSATPPPLEPACGWPVEWTTETWPVLIRPTTPAGRRLGAGRTRAGLKLIECGLDGNGRKVIEHSVIVRADRRRNGASIQLSDVSLLGNRWRR